MKLRLLNGRLLHSTSRSIAGVRNDGLLRDDVHSSLRAMRVGFVCESEEISCIEIRATNERLLHAISLSIAGVRNDDIVTRHCKHRAEDFCVVSEAISCIEIRATNERLLHPTSLAITGVRNDGVKGRHCEHRARCNGAGRSNGLL